MAARRTASGPLRGQGEQGGPGRGVAPVAQRVDQQDLLVGRQLGQLVGQRGGHLRAGQLHGRSRGGGRQHVVRAADGLEQQGNAFLAAAEDGAPQGRRPEPAAAPAAGRAGGRRSPATGAPFPSGRQRLGAAEEAFAEGAPGWRPTRRPGRRRGPGRPRACRSCPGPGRRPGPPRRRSASSLAIAGNGLGVAPHAEAADHAHQGPALELAQRVAERLVHGRVGNGLQGVAGHVRELLVAQQGGQGGDGLLGADAGQLAAGVGLLLQRRVRLEHGDQLGPPERRRRRPVAASNAAANRAEIQAYVFRHDGRFSLARWLR